MRRLEDESFCGTDDWMIRMDGWKTGCLRSEIRGRSGKAVVSDNGRAGREKLASPVKYAPENQND